MTLLNLIYCLLGAVFIVLGGVCLWEKYRTVHGGMRLPARIIRCQRQGPKNRRQSGGYCFVVEFTTPDGIRHTAHRRRAPQPGSRAAQRAVHRARLCRDLLAGSDLRERVKTETAEIL